MTAVVEGSAAVVSRSVAELLGTGVVEAGSVVWAACERESAAGWLVVERVVAGRERRCAIVMPDACSVVASGPISQVQVAAGPIPTEELMPPWVSAIAEAFWGGQDLRAERDAARAAVRAQEERLESIVDAAHEFADEHSLCGDFDEFMIREGLRPRSHDYVCEVNATVRVRIPASGRDADEAAGRIDDDMVVAALAELRSTGLLSDALMDRDVVDTEEA